MRPSFTRLGSSLIGHRGTEAVIIAHDAKLSTWSVSFCAGTTLDTTGTAFQAFGSRCRTASFWRCPRNALITYLATGCAIDGFVVPCSSLLGATLPETHQLPLPTALPPAARARRMILRARSSRRRGRPAPCRTRFPSPIVRPTTPARRAGSRTPSCCRNAGAHRNRTRTCP